MHNREKILNAADAVFLEIGINAHLDIVAERAGIGRATLFRNFPDRHALIVSLLDRSLDDIEREAARIGDDAQALRRLLRYLADQMIARAALTEYWQRIDHDSPAFLGSLRRLVKSFEQPVARAVAAGTCRQDLVPSDMVLLATMMSGALYARMPDVRRHLAERAWTFVIEMAQLRDGEAPA